MKNRKTEIIEATLELASRNGLGTVSMQQIADRVGITKASLYNHFSSRDEIVEAMYEQLRSASREHADAGGIDYERLAKGRSLQEILSEAVSSYRKMIRDPKMTQFYSIIMNERSISPAAAEIMVKETERMIAATKTMFYALQVKGIADFHDADAAAFSFAMAVHGILEYELDLEHAGMKKNQRMMKQYIEEFSRIYGKGE